VSSVSVVYDGCSKTGKRQRPQKLGKGLRPGQAGKDPKDWGKARGSRIGPDKGIDNRAHYLSTTEAHQARPKCNPSQNTSSCHIPML
jgi:hypothetical protein